MRPQVHRWVLAILPLPILLVAGTTTAVPLPKIVPRDLCTYRFAARIKDNAGITPFKVGDVIRGTIAYDLTGKDRNPTSAEHGNFYSPKNSLCFELGEQRFCGVGEIVTYLSVFEHAESIGVVAHDLHLPDGWEMDHTRRSQSYGLHLQNAPPRGVLKQKHNGLPESLSLRSFVDTRELRLDFFHGVRFPGGRVDKRATVLTTVESLEAVRGEAR